MKILCINSKPDLSYFTSRGVNLEPIYNKVNKKFPEQKVSSAINAEGKIVEMWAPNVFDYCSANFNTGEYDMIIVGWKRRDYSSKLKNCGGYTESIPLMPKRTYVMNYCIENNDYAEHEIMHTICKILFTKYGKMVYDYMDMDKMRRPYYKNDRQEDLDSNFNQTWEEITPYINLLNGNMKTWKHFKLEENTGLLGHTVADLDEKLVDKLDIVRDLCGFPFKITSGYRTEAENKAVGGVDGSAHTKRLAVDIACTDANKRLTIVGNAYNNGFVGIGIASTFIHLDIDSSLSRRIWLY